MGKRFPREPSRHQQRQQRAVKLTDLGLSAKSASGRSTDAFRMANYMDRCIPANVESWNSFATEVYSLGVVIYVLLCCEMPFANMQPKQRPKLAV